MSGLYGANMVPLREPNFLLRSPPVFSLSLSSLRMGCKKGADQSCFSRWIWTRMGFCLWKRCWQTFTSNVIFECLSAVVMICLFSQHIERRVWQSSWSRARFHCPRGRARCPEQARNISFRARAPGLGVLSNFMPPENRRPSLHIFFLSARESLLVILFCYSRGLERGIQWRGKRFH